MKTSTIFTLLLIISMQVFSQTFDEKKDWVREKYSAVENNLENFTKKEYINQPDKNYPPIGYYEFYFNSKNQLVKATYSMGEEGYSYEENYYFENEKLFFVYTEDCVPNWEMEEFAQDCFQSRTYLFNEQVFDCLIKEVKADDERSYIPNEKSEGDYNKITQQELDNAKKIMELAKNN